MEQDGQDDGWDPEVSAESGRGWTLGSDPITD